MRKTKTKRKRKEGKVKKNLKRGEREREREERERERERERSEVIGLHATEVQKKKKKKKKKVTNVIFVHTRIGVFDKPYALCLAKFGIGFRTDLCTRWALHEGASLPFSSPIKLRFNVFRTEM